MAPMTRSRATREGVVGELTVMYYVERASAGLIITEATCISEQAIGSPFTPGIYSPAQIAAWKTVTDAVHAAGGVIFCQLWHTGRVGHSFVKNGQLPVAPSAVAIPNQNHFTQEGPRPYEVPHALTLEEIKNIIQDYKQAAINAKEAGFDGVELHGAFGYLPNQFLVDNANLRTDEYGGSIENRSRFVLEILAELISVYGPNKVGVRFSPSSPSNAIIDSNPIVLYNYLIAEVNKLPMAYLHLMQPSSYAPIDHLPNHAKDALETFGPLFDGVKMVNSGYTRETGELVIESGKAQMVSYGSLFLANPDLPRRFELNAELNMPDRATMYGGGAHGYIDYPALGN